MSEETEAVWCSLLRVFIAPHPNVTEALDATLAAKQVWCSRHEADAWYKIIRAGADGSVLIWRFGRSEGVRLPRAVWWALVHAQQLVCVTDLLATRTQASTTKAVSAERQPRALHFRR